MASQLVGAFAYRFYYLRLLTAGACSSRCACCPPDGYKPNGVTSKGLLTVDEIRRVTRAFASLSIEKTRLTDGEPSLHRGFTDIITAMRENDATYRMAVTTNGYRLERDVMNWRGTGSTGINTSVGSLGARQLRAITGQGKFNQVMAGIDAAFEVGFEKIKVNTVLMRDVNHHQPDTFLNWIQHHPIQLRFTELMETGEDIELFRKHHISGQALRNELLRRDWIHRSRQCNDGPVQVFCHSDYVGEIGLIMPYEKDSCVTCNRLRVSFIGKLHLCLFDEGGVSLCDLLEDDIQQQTLEMHISAALRGEKQAHLLH